MNFHLQKGGGGDDHIFRGYPYMQGYGLGANFRKFFKWIVPLVHKHAVPVLKTGLAEVGKTALSTFGDIAKDTASGRDFKQTTTERINTAVDELKEKIERKLEGRGKKRKNTKSKSKFVKRKAYQDIFD